MAIEIVSFPMKNMVDISIVFCNVYQMAKLGLGMPVSRLGKKTYSYGYQL